MALCRESKALLQTKVLLKRDWLIVEASSLLKMKYKLSKEEGGKILVLHVQCHWSVRRELNKSMLVKLTSARVRFQGRR